MLPDAILKGVGVKLHSINYRSTRETLNIDNVVSIWLDASLKVVEPEGVKTGELGTGTAGDDELIFLSVGLGESGGVV